MRVIAVLNRDGGTFKTTDMDAFAARAVAAFAAHGHALEPRIVAGRDLVPALIQAAGEADVLLAGGGDGTISAAAGIAFHKGIALAVLPAGTMNLFARSLGIPLNLDDALAGLADGETKQVDIATANGRPFIHQFAVGIHAKLVKLREKLEYRSRVGKMLASTRAAVGAISRPPNFTAEFVTSRGVEVRRAAGIQISNNPFDEGHLPMPDRLDRGLLGIYVVPPLTLWVMLKIAWGMLRGKFRSIEEIAEREAREVTLRFPHRSSGALAVVDGELIKLAETVELRIHPRALRVVVPKAPATTETSAAILA